MGFFLRGWAGLGWLLIAVCLQFDVVSELCLLDIKLEDFCIGKPFSFARIYRISSEI